MHIDTDALFFAVLFAVTMGATIFTIIEYIEFGSDSPIWRRFFKKEAVEELDSDSRRVQAYVRLATGDADWKLR